MERIGDTVAGYRIESVLGRGGMSVVYLAEQVRLGRKVALKMLSSGLASDDTFRERFEREARQAAEIDHPNIVPVHDAGEADGRLYIAMRLVEGRDLGTVIEADGALGAGRALFILEQAAAALDAAHARGLVHRDVKPANILVEDGSERAYVTDFGIAKRAAAPGMTRTGFFLGTVDYAAPEQIEGKPVGARTDVYALGCVLFECLAGTTPFERENEVAVMHAHLTEAPPSLTAVRPELPAALDHVLARAMAKSSDERYASCGDLVAAARSALLGTGSAADRQAVSAGRTRGAPPRRAVIWSAAVALAAAAVAAGVVLLLDRGDDPGGGSETTTSSDDGVQPAEYLPTGLLDACKKAPIYSDSSATAVCAPPDDGSDEFFPPYVMVALYSSSGVYEAYSTEARAHGFDPPKEMRACDNRTWKGTASWSHGPSSPGGSRFCDDDGTTAVLMWTHEDNGEPDHENIFAIARAPVGKRAELLDWWRKWRNSIGRPTF